jgi:phage shock protein PspC (stress-responsive transcriptional regulator)
MTETTSQPPQTPPPPPPAGGDFFDRLRALGIARPAEGRWVGGVAAGLARRWNVDPLLVRGIFVALTIVSGIGLLLYGVAWALLPEDDGSIHLQSAIRGDITAGLVGSGLFVLLFILMGGPDNGPGPIWWGFPGILVAGLIALGVWYWATRSGSGKPPAGGTPPPYGTPPGTTGHPGYPATGAYPTTGYPAPPRPQGAPYTGGPAYGTPPPVPPRPPIPPQPPRPPRPPKSRRPNAASHRITRLTLGLAILAVAAVVVVGQIVDADGGDTTVVAMAAGLATIGVGAVVAGARGRKSGGLAPIGVLLAIALAIAGAAATSGIRVNDHVSVLGDRDWHPTTAVQAEREYNLGVGDATLWLTDPRIVSTKTGIRPIEPLAQVGAGTLTVVVPDGVASRVTVEIGGGVLERPDGSTRRFNDDGGDDQPETLYVGPSGAPVFSVTARMGFGEVVVRTASATRTASPAVTPSASATTPAPAVSAAPSVPAATVAPTTTSEVTP